MIPEWPFKHLVSGDFLVYAGRREDEADIEPLWQPLYDFNHPTRTNQHNGRQRPQETPPAQKRWSNRSETPA